MIPELSKKLNAYFVESIPLVIKQYLLKYASREILLIPIFFPPSSVTTGKYFPRIGFGFKKIDKKKSVLDEFVIDNLSFLNNDEGLQLIFRGESLQSNNIVNRQSILINFKKTAKSLLLSNYYYASADYGVLLNFLSLRDSGYYNGVRGDKFIYFIGNDFNSDDKWCKKLEYLIEYAEHRGMTLFIVKVKHVSFEPNFQIGSGTVSIIAAVAFCDSLVIYGLDQHATDRTTRLADMLCIKNTSIDAWLQGLITLYYLKRVIDDYPKVSLSGYAGNILNDPQISLIFEKYYYK